MPELVRPLKDVALYNAAVFSALRRPWSYVQRQVQLSKPYAALLQTGAREFPTFTPKDPWPGRVEIADALFQGRYEFGGQAVALPGQTPWAAHPPNDDWAEALHGFAWLRHFAASGGDAARRHVQGLVKSWLAQGQRCAVAWRPHVAARRLIAWAWHAPFFLGKSAPQDLQRSVAQSALRAARHLSRSARSVPSGPPQVTAAVGLVFAGLTQPDSAPRLRKGLRLLYRALARQILADGGHVSRNPSHQHAVLADLCALRRALREADQEVPDFIQHTINGMAPMLRFFRHGDGGLALFNGGFEEADGMVDWTLALAEAPGTHVSPAYESGFYRIVAGRTVLLLDAGGPPLAPYDRLGHAGCLSFEFSAGRQRLIVNCGSGRGRDSEWEGSMRSTAAHSTLTLGDQSSSRFRRGFIGRFIGPGVAQGPRTVETNQVRQEGRQWIDSYHDGYAAAFGFLHRRRLYLDENGTDLRGEDRLELAPDRARLSPISVPSVPFAVRFHLHPNVRPVRMGAEGSVALILPDGEIWDFRVRGGTIGVEESVYLGTVGAVRPTHQIVVSGIAEDLGAVVKWALQRRSRTVSVDAAPPSS